MLRVRLLGGLALDGPRAAREPAGARAARVARAAPGHALAAGAGDALLAGRPRGQRPREPAHDAARAAARARRRGVAPGGRPRAGRAGRRVGRRARLRGAAWSRPASCSPGSTATGRSPPATSTADRVAAELADAAPTARDGLRWAREAVTRRPAVRRRRAPADARCSPQPATAPRRCGVRAARGPAGAGAVGRAVTRDAAAAGGDPRRRARPPLGSPHAPAGARPARRARAGRAGARAPHGPLAGAPRAERSPRAAAPAAVLLAGEPGIGKTRLLAEAGRAPTRAAPPCSTAAATRSPCAVRAVRRGARGRRAGRCRAPRTASAGGCSRRSARGCRARVLLLDDLHWADAGTLRLLAHVLRRPDAPAVLGAYRDTEVSRAHPLADALADLRRDASDRADRAPAGCRPPRSPSWSRRSGRSALHDETGGNPFFIEQVLADGGDGIPEGVKDVIGRRLNRLAPATGRGAAVAAVAGREFDAGAARGGAARRRRARRARGGARIAHGHARSAAGATRSRMRWCARRSTTSSASPAACARTARSPTRWTRSRTSVGRARSPPARGRRARACGRRAGRGARGDAGTRLRGRGGAVRAGARRMRRRDPRACCSHSARRGCGPARPSKDVFARAAARERRPEVLARAALGFSGLGVTIIAVDAQTVALLEDALDHDAGRPSAACPAVGPARDRDLLRVDARGSARSWATRRWARPARATQRRCSTRSMPATPRSGAPSTWTSGSHRR